MGLFSCGAPPSGKISSVVINKMYSGKRRSSPSRCGSNDRLGDGCNTRAVTSVGDVHGTASCDSARVFPTGCGKPRGVTVLRLEFRQVQRGDVGSLQTDGAAETNRWACIISSAPGLFLLIAAPQCRVLAEPCGKCFKPVYL